DNTIHRWPLTPRITARLRAKGATQRIAGFEADRAALGVRTERDARGHLVMTVPGPHDVGPTGAEGAEGDDAWVLWIHGGGFCWGSARDGTGLRLAAGLRRPIVSVEYPLAPQARFPVA